VAVRHTGIGDALGGMDRAAAEDRELDRRAARQRRERADALGRHVVGDEEDGLHVSAAS
jgi:hypothetical protein